MNIRETFSYFNMAQSITCIAGNTAVQTGADVNRQGYDSLTFFVNVQQVSATTLSETTSFPYKLSAWWIRMQHTDASALGLGPSTYVDCASIDVIRTWSGAMQSGTNASGVTAAGIALYILPSYHSGTVVPIGYRGNKQYVRVLLSELNMTMGASNVIDVVAMLGHAENWPVSVPNLDA